ncbi:hypothetical protein ACH8LZ_004811, partial [Escherichia coli]
YVTNSAISSVLTDYILNFPDRLLKTPALQLNANCTTPQRHCCFDATDIKKPATGGGWRNS